MESRGSSAAVAAFLGVMERAAPDSQDPEVQHAARQLLECAKDEPDCLATVCDSLDAQPLPVVAWTAMIAGIAVEQGADANASFPPIWTCFEKRIARLPVPDPEADEGPEPDPAAASIPPEDSTAFAWLCQSLVSHLAALPERRRALGRDADCMDRLQSVSDNHHGILWVLEALRRRSGFLVAIHPQARRGFRVRFDNVGNGFHLFSLLQVALGTRLPGGRGPDPGIVHTLDGSAEQRLSDSACWHYGHPSSPRPNIAASIWGEGSIDEIPCYDGDHVLLLWPPILQSRSWNSAFFGPHLQRLPASANVVEELDVDTCDAWLRRLGVDAEAASAPLPESRRKPWWRIW